MLGARVPTYPRAKHIFLQHTFQPYSASNILNSAIFDRQARPKLFPKTRRACNCHAGPLKPINQTKNYLSYKYPYTMCCKHCSVQIYGHLQPRFPDLDE